MHNESAYTHDNIPTYFGNTISLIQGMASSTAEFKLQVMRSASGQSNQIMQYTIIYDLLKLRIIFLSSEKLFCDGVINKGTNIEFLPD
ncbi:hypothetical protein RIR_jg8704.t1 [Rhizophagus irregularis DAOM 181602=DAOM 197198]|nr:hypothetical protein RIR_jg8704.t1 [Rhizophagus irregularis DAOM 181602=DAOM 197198]